jgi:hypothetical protein
LKKADALRVERQLGFCHLSNVPDQQRAEKEEKKEKKNAAKSVASWRVSNLQNPEKMG